MADDEQFSLCWNNFNSNLSAGFHESLCRGDLVDVTLAAEGQFVKAHRLVLSVCSPYFRKLFTQMPANQHAFVFLKDVSHTALKDLIQFMYCGEVNVKQEALPAFISTAEALQIKGLTDSDPPAQSPAEPSSVPVQQQLASPRVRQRTQTQRSTYKIDTLDDNVDTKMQQPTQIVIQTTTAPPQATITQQTQHLQNLNQQQHIAAPIVNTGTTTTNVVTQKRPAQRTSVGGAPHIKRTKSTIDPLEMSEIASGGSGTTGTQQITVQTAVVSAPPELKSQQTSDTEYIDLPMEISTKAEPDYSEETGDVDGGDNDGTAYVEDDSYGEVRYDENYFTENEDGGPTTATVAVSSGATGGVTTATTSKSIVKQQPVSFSDSSYADAGDQNNSDAQDQKLFYFMPYPIGTWLTDQKWYLIRNQKQGYNLIFHGYMYKKEASFRTTANWICSNGNGKRLSQNKCTARCITKMEGAIKLGKNPHNHPPKFTSTTLPDGLIDGATMNIGMHELGNTRQMKKIEFIAGL